jgi:hypothetical protein
MTGVLLLLVPLLSLCAGSRGCSPEFVSVPPESVVVRDGESLSLSCVVADMKINEWFIDGLLASSVLPDGNYVIWTGCTDVAGTYCGGTLFIKHVSKSLSGRNVSCQVAHLPCNGDNVTMSPPTVITAEL